LRTRLSWLNGAGLLLLRTALRRLRRFGFHRRLLGRPWRFGFYRWFFGGPWRFGLRVNRFFRGRVGPFFFRLGLARHFPGNSVFLFRPVYPL
jgi:hypothetical protein